MDTSLFFQLIQIAIGCRRHFAEIPSLEQWDSLFETSKKQALLGVAFYAVQQLPSEQRPPRLLLVKWAGLAAKIEQKNRLLNSQCRQVIQVLQEEGFDICVLKGQGNLSNYPEQLRAFRNPGDIDLWVWPKGEKKNKRRVIEYVFSHVSQEVRQTIVSDMRLHHIDYPFFKETPVELHFSPAVLNSPFANHALQRFFQSHQGDLVVDSQGLVTPSSSFNVIYQLVHLYKHLFSEGIGLRQLMDYYYVLQAFCADADYETLRTGLVLPQIDALGMRKFTTAVMYVLQQVFRMPDSMLLCPYDADEGAFLLAEIMSSGNFGRFDEAQKNMREASKFARFFMLTRRNWHFLSRYPSESFWNPYRRAYNVVWRRLELWRW